MQKIEVLDKGHVQYMDHMGTDLSVVNAARVSFDKESDWEKKVFESEEEAESFGDLDWDWVMSDMWMGGYLSTRLSDRDTKLIHYLAEHSHWTPFGQCNLQLRIKMPIFVARQMMRSNVGIVWNEVSRRYVDSEPEFYEPVAWRGRPKDGIKQGSGEVIPSNTWLDTVEWEGPLDSDVNEQTENIFYLYKAMLDAGVAPEMSRMVLPQSTYTEVVGNFTLAALARVCALREDPHAQWEIQQYAKAMGEIAKQYFPVSWAALTGGGE